MSIRDTYFIPYDFGFDQIGVGALEDGSGVPHDFMSVEAVAARPGYIYIYLPTVPYKNRGFFNIKTEAAFAPATFNLGLQPGDDGFIYSEGNKIGEATLNINAKLNYTQKMIWRAMGWR